MTQKDNEKRMTFKGINLASASSLAFELLSQGYFIQTLDETVNFKV